RGPNRHRELAAALQHDQAARIARIQAASTGGICPCLRRVAGCATPTGSAGHASATASLKLTFHLDHSVGANQRGATNVAVSVAGGAYQFGWVDMPSLVRFNAQNPAAPLIAVYVSFDETPLAVITRKDAKIRKPADLDGKKIAGGPGTAVHDT